MRIGSWTLRHWLVLAFAAIGVGLVPWTVWLAASLKQHHVTENWDVAWTGFDVGLTVSFLATAVAAFKRSPWIAVCAAATGTLLVTDAWFDSMLENRVDEIRNAVVLALFVELPLAAFCFWIAYRTERVLTKAVETVSALHLAPAGESPAESDLVGVLEIPADGEPAREPGYADPSA